MQIAQLQPAVAVSGPSAGRRESFGRIARRIESAPAAGAVNLVHAAPSTLRLYAAARANRGEPLVECVAAVANAIVDATRGLLATWRQHRDARAIEVALRHLDRRTLSDLGIDRREVLPPMNRHLRLP
jgi:hypothetical protein